MDLSLGNIELHVLSLAAIRCLIAKGILTEEDLMADLARQGIDSDTAFKIHALLSKVPKK